MYKHKKFPGLSQTCKDFEPFKIIDYIQDPGYGYQHVLMFFIQFKTTQKLGLCIYDTKEQAFIEEPGELEAYDHTEESIAIKYGFKVPRDKA